MASQAFPDSGHPGVLVHVPPSFQPDVLPWYMVLFLHGWYNCIQNVILPGLVGISCTEGQPPRQAYNLSDQFDAIGLNALLVVPELEYDAPSSDPGQLGESLGFRNFLTELLGPTALGSVLPPQTMASVGKISIMEHSGGYWGEAVMATQGGVPQIQQVVLFDGLYGFLDRYQDLILDANLAVGKYDNTSVSGLSTCNSLKFGNIFSRHGGTMKNSIEMVDHTASFLNISGLDQSLLLYTPFEISPSQYSTPIIIKFAELSHDNIPRVYFPEFVRQFANDCDLV